MQESEFRDKVLTVLGELTNETKNLVGRLDKLHGTVARHETELGEIRVLHEKASAEILREHERSLTEMRIAHERSISAIQTKMAVREEQCPLVDKRTKLLETRVIDLESTRTAQAATQKLSEKWMKWVQPAIYALALFILYLVIYHSDAISQIFLHLPANHPVAPKA